jgi:AcrR family transcriptional regulator
MRSAARSSSVSPSSVSRRGGGPAGSGTGRRGGAQISEVQRSRMLHSAVQVVSEYGYGRMSVARVTGGARVSRRTFYDVFEDREDCFLAVFDDTVARVSDRVAEAYGRGDDWLERVRLALTVLLGLLEEEHGVRSLLIVDALGAGPRVLERRAEVLQRLGASLHEGGSGARVGRDLPPLTGEGVVGAVLSVLHTRLSKERPVRMLGLLGPLMGMIVLPYLGAEAAQLELERPAPRASRASRPRRSEGASRVVGGGLFDGLPMRVTYRTLRVLSVIGEHPGASNRKVAAIAGISDQGQMSKLLTRLERLGLVENTGHGQSHGESNAWRLTARGEQVESAVGVQPDSTEHQAQGNGPLRRPHES